MGKTIARLSKKLFLPMIVVAITLYVVDVGSDIYLAWRYFHEGDTNWGICTTVFVVIPWIIFLFTSQRIVKCGTRPIKIFTKVHHPRCIVLIFAIFDMFPVALLLLTLMQKEPNVAPCLQRYLVV